MANIELRRGKYRLLLAPDRGGSILDFEWDQRPLLRPTRGLGIFDVACFPIVPFCNRIAHGRFAWGKAIYTLEPNFPGSDHPHPLHGFGWLSSWRAIENGHDFARLEHRPSKSEWPWPYVANQTFRLAENGLTICLELFNASQQAMPAAVGFHPYFPRTVLTRYCGMHQGEWQNDATCIPVALDRRGLARDWWEGGPVGSRTVDTVYTERDGSLLIDWPERRLGVTIACSSNLSFTCVYVPPGAEWFCVEPVSSMTDAVNRTEIATGLVSLSPGASLRGEIQISARPQGAMAICSDGQLSRPIGRPK